MLAAAAAAVEVPDWSLRDSGVLRGWPRHSGRHLALQPEEPKVWNQVSKSPSSLKQMGKRKGAHNPKSKSKTLRKNHETSCPSLLPLIWRRRRRSRWTFAVLTSLRCLAREVYGAIVDSRFLLFPSPSARSFFSQARYRCLARPFDARSFSPDPNGSLISACWKAGNPVGGEKSPT